jgi:prepilin-type N-terminal cleavage/methylation domain-containing protein
MTVIRRRRESGMTLIELLIGMTVMTVISTMMLLGWFSLQKSYSYSVRSNDQRDSGRQTLSRMQREVRDAEARPLPNTDPAIYRARTFWTAFYTTFNEAGNTSSGKLPHMVMYRLYSNGELWRFEDLDNSGTLSGVSMSPSPDDPSVFDTHEIDMPGQWTGTGEGGVVNFSQNPSNPTPLFRYMYYDDTGTLVTANNAYNSTGGNGQGHNDRSNTVAVIMRAVVDLVPGHAPIAADLQITAQLRNQR